MVDDHGRGWRKSSRCDDQHIDCVELAVGEESVHLRETGNRTGGELIISGRSWCAFVAQQKEL
ncbi:DUF397 domain-containing protein [Amycolatopsis sp. NBC_01488]|uniref:DUF397 domain-containing protein n=1 Tax=Amycolatopsis sp. NBC_01488 TaxID=2903563 RepID=UPI002E2BFC45|nr:DUF397 domain-containing protein [Amycolatopsis sp. NBC_01488]